MDRANKKAEQNKLFRLFVESIVKQMILDVFLINAFAKTVNGECLISKTSFYSLGLLRRTRCSKLNLLYCASQ